MSLFNFEYFTKEELACKCGCSELIVNRDFIYKIELLRKALQFPFIVNSFYRCEDHNKKVGGSPDSYHLVGRAMDIKASGVRALEIIENARKYGITGIGAYEGFIHLDDRDASKGKFGFWVGN